KDGDAGSWTSWNINNAGTTGYPDGTYGKESTHWRWGASYCNTTTVLPMPGYRYNDGILTSTGNVGFYWSSTAAYYLNFKRNVVTTSLAGSLRGYGYPVRCVLQH
ncbi:MAG: hypothetical protein LBB85_06340, partial [Dysgonamonadaceae bacterium]|nr:hypothetical protein [Dysgonamonadaceae bacterium]